MSVALPTELRARTRAAALTRGVSAGATAPRAGAWGGPSADRANRELAPQADRARRLAPGTRHAESSGDRHVGDSVDRVEHFEHRVTVAVAGVHRQAVGWIGDQ